MCSVVSAKGFDSKRIRLSRCHHPCWLPSVLPDTRVSIESDGPEQNTHTYHDQKQERKYIVNEKQRKHVVIPSRRPADVQQRSSARVRLANSSRPTSSEAETNGESDFCRTSATICLFRSNGLSNGVKFESCEGAPRPVGIVVGATHALNPATLSATPCGSSAKGNSAIIESTAVFVTISRHPFAHRHRVGSSQLCCKRNRSEYHE